MASRSDGPEVLHAREVEETPPSSNEVAMQALRAVVRMRLQRDLIARQAAELLSRLSLEVARADEAERAALAMFEERELLEVALEQASALDAEERVSIARMFEQEARWRMQAARAMRSRRGRR